VHGEAREIRQSTAFYLFFVRNVRRSAENFGISTQPEAALDTAPVLHYKFDDNANRLGKPREGNSMVAGGGRKHLSAAQFCDRGGGLATARAVLR
jgi:hypothetical protein